MPDVDYINELAVEKNFSLGRSFVDCPKVLYDLYYLFQQENKDPLGFNVKNHLFSSEYIEDNILNRKMNGDEKKYYESTLVFLEKINYSDVLGITPLDKALNVLMYLVHLSKQTNKEHEDKIRNGWDAQGANMQDAPVNVENEGDIAAAINELADGVNLDIDAPTGDSSNGQNHKEELSKEITKCVRDHLYDLTPSIANVYGKTKPSDVPINRSFLSDIKIKAYLEESVGLNTALDSKKVKNNDSHEKDTFKMESVDEVTKVRKSSMMLENFDDKLIKKELNIKTKVKPEEKKQILYMLLDDSGSMSCLHKQTYVRAVLLNRLESVVDGKSELKFCLYESQRYEFSNAKDKESASTLMKKISLRRPCGGGTHIGRVIQETIDEIHHDATTGYHDPEIMIVCDGDDYVDPKSIDYKDVRINVVLLGTSNKNLKRVAEESGGFYICEKLYDRY